MARLRGGSEIDAPVCCMFLHSLTSPPPRPSSLLVPSPHFPPARTPQNFRIKLFPFSCHAAERGRADGDRSCYLLRRAVVAVDVDQTQLVRGCCFFFFLPPAVICTTGGELSRTPQAFKHTPSLSATGGRLWGARGGKRAGYNACF